MRMATSLATLATNISVCVGLGNLLLVVVLGITCISSVSGEPEGPIGYGGGVADSQADLEAALNYMKKYTGLPQSTSPAGVGSLISHTDIASTITNMQRYMNVPLTGRVDSQTRSKMSQPRCGVPDPSGQDVQGHALGGRMRRFAHTGGKWSKTKLTYRLLNSPQELSMARTTGEMSRAFGVWEAITPLEFREVPSGHADIYISFGENNHGDSFPFDGPGFTLAHAFPPQSGWGELDGDVHFDDAETFTISSYDGVNLFQVAAHEIGHSLGLAHSTDGDALMAPFYPGYIDNFKLPYDDQRGIQELYGSRTKPVDPATTKRPDPGPNPGPTTKTPDSRCRSDYDAITLVRGELFAFQGEKYWRMRFPHEMISRTIGEPTAHFWQAFPNNIDAAYERYYDQKIFFFKGNEYYKYNGLSLIAGYPKPISELDPKLPSNLDAVIGFEEYSKTYFLKGRKVWRYDEVAKRVDDGYPVNIKRVFPGVPTPVSSAFLHKDGAAYFLKGFEYSRYNDTLKRVEDGYPRRFGVDFLGCDPKQLQIANKSNSIGVKGGSDNLKPTGVCLLLVTLLAMFTSFQR